jgi:hypothetical protein
MKTSKIKTLVLIIFLIANITVSFSQGEPDPWTAPPPTFEDDTNDNTPPLPINTDLYYLVFSGLLLAGYSIIRIPKKVNR